VGLVSVALLRDKASTRTPATITSTRWRRHATSRSARSSRRSRRT